MELFNSNIIIFVVLLLLILLILILLVIIVFQKKKIEYLLKPKYGFLGKPLSISLIFLGVF
ncbi:MAG: hypothetical protein NZZ41_06080, partial [Candidatus Dojkabacteria bacterium]|nr:hypothetical protein [Candidatus Dojkabacteria bacterium]